MRLERAEAEQLPLPACLCGPDSRPLAATPEWKGASPGTLTYYTGHGHLLVAPEDSAPELDVVTRQLLDTLTQAAAAAGQLTDSGRRLAVLAAGLQLVAGQPPVGRGSVSEVVQLALAAIAARTQGLTASAAGPLPALFVPAPAAVALALVQMAVNAQRHQGVRTVGLRVAAGPTFYVEWPAGSAGGRRLRSHRHALRRSRWGWGYVQMVADSLGGSALPPGPTAPGREGASLGLGSRRLALPLACVHRGRVERSTLTWDQDTDMPGFGQPLAGPLAELVDRAQAEPGQIAYRDLYRARCRGNRTWIALAPETGSVRARDLLRGLGHERALWSAPEPYATRAQALTTLLAGMLGEPLPSVPPSVWSPGLATACAALGIPPPPPASGLVMPDPRLAAFLLAEVGGRLEARDEEIHLAPERPQHPLLARLVRTSEGFVRLIGAAGP